MMKREDCFKVLARHVPAGALRTSPVAGGLYLWCRTPDPDKLADPGVHDRARISPGCGFGSPDHVRLCIARAGLNPTGAAAAVVATLREG